MTGIFLVLAIISTLSLIYDFVMEFTGYLKAQHGDWEVIFHLMIDVIKMAIYMATIWVMFGILASH